MLTETELLQKNVSSTEYDGKRYFVVDEVRKAFPHTKFPQEKIIVLSIYSSLMDTILLEDIQEMTEFDLKILQTLSYNPQKR